VVDLGLVPKTFECPDRPEGGNMTPEPQITFRNMDLTPELEEAVRKETARLDCFFNRIVSCRVVVERPRRQKYGGLYRIRIDLGVPGKKLVVDHNPTQHAGLQEREAQRTTRQSEPDRERRDACTAIREAFQEMRRRLQDYAHRIRGQVKRHKGRSAAAGAPIPGTRAGGDRL
jgi:ribosome-associated translation inhibitor RaiA